jgi:hypothetical protein
MLSKQMDKVYLLAVKNNLGEAAEFLKGLISKYDIIENKGKNGNRKTK